MRRPHAFLIALALAGGACRLLVGVDEHHLRDDSDAADGEGGPAETSVDAQPGSDADAHADAGDAGLWTVTVLASGRTRPSSIVAAKIGNVLPWYVFWLEESVGDGGAIMRVVDNGTLGTAETLALPDNPRGMRFDQTPGIAFTDDTRPVARLWHVGLVPPAPRTLYDEDLAGLSFGAIGVISPYAFTEAREPDDSGVHVRRSSFDASAGPTCFNYSSADAGGIPSISFDGNNVYFATLSGDIVRTFKGCNEPGVVFAADQHAVALVLDAKYLYWLTADGHVRSRDKAMSGPITTYAASLVAPGGISDQNGALYFTDEGAGLVYEALPDAGPTVIARGQGGPHGILMTTAVPPLLYWTNRTTGEIVRATP